MSIKKVVYTVLTGNYEQLAQHSYVDASYDYICFSNDFKDSRIGIWKIRKISLNSNENQLVSRFPKLQPHKVLKDYDISLYVDANVNIKTKFIFDSIEQLHSKGISFAGVKHQERDCLYEESLMVLLKGKERNFRKVKEQMSFYKKNHFPKHFGLYEANVIYRIHNSEDVIKQSNDWWFWRKNYSRRDQLSLSYTLWENNIPLHFLLPENQSTRNSKEISCNPHPITDKYIILRLKNAYCKFIIPIIFRLFFPIYYRLII